MVTQMRIGVFASSVLVATLLFLTFAPSPRATEELPLDPEVLGLATLFAKKQADFWQLAAVVIETNLSPEQVLQGWGIVGEMGRHLLKSNPTRGIEIFRFIDVTLRPAIIENRDDFSCRSARQFYKSLEKELSRIAQTDDATTRRNEFLTDTKVRIESGSLIPITWHDMIFYYFMSLGFSELQSLGLKAYRREFSFAEIDLSRPLGPADFLTIESNLLGDKAPCASPWSPQ